ncbi:MAG: universal stress protein [Syntrophomonadaceae bacterium]|nr:universal stress protein [Syntrophomonadaceae bacterium]
MLVEKAVVGTDFSPQAAQLVDCVAELRSIGLKEIVLVHVLDVRTPGGAAVGLGDLDRALLDRKKEALEALGLQVKTAVPVGFPAAELVRVAREEKASLIVVASHGKGFVKEVFLGSTTADLIRTSTVPVLVEKLANVDSDTCLRACRQMFQSVLLPIDFSAYSTRVVDIAKEMAGVMGSVTLLSSVERAADRQELERARAQAEEWLEGLRQEFEGLGVRCAVRVTQGSASRAILATAQELGVTLIMMGTRGQGMLTELVLGSTAHAVTRRATCAVVLVPPRRLRRSI